MERTRIKDDVEDKDRFFERKITTGLITNTAYIKQIRDVFNIQFMASSSARKICSWCIEYYDKYKEAPGKKIDSIYYQKITANKISKSEGEDIEDILFGLSKEHENSKTDQYLVDSTIHYFQLRQGELHTEGLELALKNNDLNTFHSLQACFKPVQLVNNEQRKLKPSELYTMKPKEVEWLIQDLIPKGLTIFGGASKLGKSYLTLNIIMNLAQGHWMFTDDSSTGFRGKRGHILYLALEDTEDRIVKRMKNIDPNPNLKLLDKYLQIERRWDMLYSGGLNKIEDWLKEKERSKLVVIDVIEKVAPKSVKTGAGRYYTEEYAKYGPLSDLAHKYNISIILITHTKKSREADVFNEILGGSGTYGPADNLMVLSRIPGSPDKRQLSIRGKDADDLHLTFEVSREGSNWECLGEVDELDKTYQRQSISNYLQIAGPKTFDEIKQAIRDGEINMSINSINTTLRRMISNGELEQDMRRGKYSVAGYTGKIVDLGVSDKLKKGKGL